MLNACHSCVRRSLAAALRAAFASALAVLVASALRDFGIRSEYGGLYCPASPHRARRSAWSPDGRLSGSSSSRCDSLLVEPPRAIRRTHQRAGQYAREPQLLGVVGVLDEFLGFDPPQHGVVTRRRAQVLGDRDHLAARAVQIAQSGADLV